MPRPDPPVRRFPVETLSAVYIGLMVTFALAGAHTSQALRVVVAGRAQIVGWTPGCACWIVRLRPAAGSDLDLEIDGQRAVQEDQHVFVVGRLDPGYPKLVRVDWFGVLQPPEITPVAALGWLHGHPLPATI